MTVSQPDCRGPTAEWLAPDERSQRARNQRQGIASRSRRAHAESRCPLETGPRWRTSPVVSTRTRRSGSIENLGNWEPPRRSREERDYRPAEGLTAPPAPPANGRDHVRPCGRTRYLSGNYPRGLVFGWSRATNHVGAALSAGRLTHRRGEHRQGDRPLPFAGSGSLTPVLAHLRT